MSSITCRAVSKHFGSTQVLDGLDLEVPDGTVVSLLGQSGSGKTTLLRLIAGFERPDAGSVLIDDEVVDGPRRFVPPEKRRIGFVAQEGNLFPHLTIARNVAFGLGRSERGSGRVEEMLELVGLGDLGGRYPHQLSGGQQQRVALARALARRPRVVLLDEPFSSLDAGLRSSLRTDVMRILRDQHATTVFVTHDQSEALSVADLVGLVDAGRIRQFAAPEDLYEAPTDPAVAQFLGEANILSGTVAGDRADTPLGSLALAGGTGQLAGPVTVLVRPEQIVLHREGDRSGPGGEPGPAAGEERVELGEGREGHGGRGSGPAEPGRAGPATGGEVRGRVVHREYYGHDCIVLIDVTGPDSLLRVRCPGRAPVEVGDSVTVSVPGPVAAWPAGAGEGIGTAAEQRAER